MKLARLTFIAVAIAMFLAAPTISPAESSADAPKAEAPAAAAEAPKAEAPKADAPAAAPAAAAAQTPAK